METRNASSSPDPLGSPGDPAYLLSSAKKTVSRPMSAMNTPSPSKRRPSRRNAAASRRDGASVRSAKQQQQQQQSFHRDDFVLPSTPSSTRKSNPPTKQQLHSNATLSPWRTDRENANDGQQPQAPTEYRRKNIPNAMPSIEEDRVLVPSGGEDVNVADRRRRKSNAYSLSTRPDTGVKRAIGNGDSDGGATAGSAAKRRKSSSSRRALASMENYNDVNGHSKTNNTASPTEENVFTPRPEDLDPFLDIPLDETPRPDNRINGDEQSHAQAPVDFFPETPLEDIPEPSIADMGSNFRTTLHRPPRRVNFSSPTKTPARTGLTPENTINAGHTPAPKIGLRKLTLDNKDNDGEEGAEAVENEVESEVDNGNDGDQEGSELGEQTEDEDNDQVQSTRRRLFAEEEQESRTMSVHDPTDEHRGFDSIMESEQFTMILPDKLPSSHQVTTANGTGEDEKDNTRHAAHSESQESKQSDILAPVTNWFGKIAGLSSRTATTDGVKSTSDQHHFEPQVNKTFSPQRSPSASAWWKKGPTRPVIQHRQTPPPVVDVTTEPPAQSTPRPTAPEPSPKLPPTPWWLRSPARSAAPDTLAGVQANGSPSPRKTGNNVAPSPSKMLRLTPWWSRSPARIPLVRKDLTPAPSSGRDGLKTNLFAQNNMMNSPSHQTRLDPTRARNIPSQPSISPQKGPTPGRAKEPPPLSAIAEEENMSPTLSFSSSSVDEDEIDQGSPTPNKRQDQYPSRSFSQRHSPHASPSARKQTQQLSNSRNNPESSSTSRKQLTNESRSGPVRPETPESSISPPQMTPLKNGSRGPKKADFSHSQNHGNPSREHRSSRSRTDERPPQARQSSLDKQSPQNSSYDRHQRTDFSQDQADHSIKEPPPRRHDINSYPSHTHRKVLSTSGYFTDEHYLALRNLYQRAEAHPERFPYIRSTRRDSLLGREITSADGRYRRTVTQLQISVVDRFRDDLSYWDKRQNGGNGKVAWGDWELLRRLFSIIVGAEIRKEKARSHRKNRGHSGGNVQEHEHLEARKGQKQQQRQK